MPARANNPYCTSPLALSVSLAISLLLILTACGGSGPPPHPTTQVTPKAQASPTPEHYDFPFAPASYVYDQLYYMSMTFKRRESGFDNDPENNGHKAFAQYWSQEMVKNLQGLGPQVFYDYFQSGWIARPGTSPGYNVEITIPGAVHPEQEVVIGTHYDGMHVSQGSAFDDTSGCAIILGLARALGDYWRSHHLYPARTVRFVIFDAEEQGILGSYDYVNTTINGGTPHIALILNEEQSGLSYPARFLGKASNPLMPLHIWNVSGNQTYFTSTINAALPAVAAEMRTMGFTSMIYQDEKGQDMSMPIFTNEQVRRFVMAGEELGGSDEAAFVEAKVPALTFFADNGSTESLAVSGIPKDMSFPFDTELDTIQLLNGYVSGGTKKSPALMLALHFQMMLQAWMLNQQDMIGTISAAQVPAGPLAAISDIGILKPGLALKLNAQGAFDPQSPQSQFNYHWDFGDGTQVNGVEVQHTYARAGAFSLTLTVKNGPGARRIQKTLVVADTTPHYTGNQQYLDTIRSSNSTLKVGDNHPGDQHQSPPIVQNGDGLTDEDHFPGHP